MPSNALSQSTAMTWTGRIIGTLPALFLLLDAAMKFVKPEFVVKATTALGFSESVIVPLGAVLLASTMLYLVPQTCVLGAILLTGYLGGAVATNVLVRHGWLDVFFPVLFGVLLWGGLWLRDARIRLLTPLDNHTRPSIHFGGNSSGGQA